MIAFKRVIKEFLTGLSFQQEYLCMGLESFQQGLNAFLSTEDSHWYEDVTITHILLGYKPLIIGIALTETKSGSAILKKRSRFCLSFNQNSFSLNHLWNGLPVDRKSVARLLLRKIKHFKLGDSTVFLFEGLDYSHRLISPFHQLLNNFIERYRWRKSSNVDLNKNLYNQVRIGYAIPRKISLITLIDEHYVNVFPTDLHGSLNKNFYVSSLRIGGSATNQVEQSQKIVLSDIDVHAFKEVYALGKNHVTDLQPKHHFSEILSSHSHAQIPIPKAAIRYKVLKQVSTFDYGIHRIHFYAILQEGELKNGITLAHVHQYIAQWRKAKNIVSNYLIR
jgi:hypothetical protein